MNFHGIHAITFDCYGTLIDWECGLLAALGRMFGGGRAAGAREAVLRAFARHEREVEAGAYMTYRDVLAEVARRLAAEMGIALRPGDEGVLAESIKDWPAFAETPGALRALRERFRLAVLSNIDDDLFEGSRPRLGVQLDELVTAEQVRSYKPGRAHFEEALRRLRLRPEQVLHVAESRYHDIGPANAMGFRTVWVNRHPSGGSSASGEHEARPDMTVSDLAALISTIGV